MGIARKAVRCMQPIKACRECNKNKHKCTEPFYGLVPIIHFFDIWLKYNVFIELFLYPACFTHKYGDNLGRR